MGKTDRLRKAESELQAILLGAEILGVNFGGGLIVVFWYPDPHLSDPRPVYGGADIYLHIESRWTGFPTEPDRLPEREEELPELTIVQGVSLLAGLQGQPIRAVRLGERHAHLVITFQSGAVVFVHGNHEHFESWNISVHAGPTDRTDLIVALAGGDVALFSETPA